MKYSQLTQHVITALQQKNYDIQYKPSILLPVKALLYARSSAPRWMGFSVVEDFYLFVDWTQGVSAQLSNLLEIYSQFSQFANQYYRVPHAWRIRIPNLALVVISDCGFSDEIVQQIRLNYMSPWYGGETGQIILLDYSKKELIFHDRPTMPRRTPIPGALPLGHAAETIKSTCHYAFSKMTGNED